MGAVVATHAPPGKVSTEVTRKVRHLAGELDAPETVAVCAGVVSHVLVNNELEDPLVGEQVETRLTELADTMDATRTRVKERRAEHVAGG
jgi:predicted transcriptional regulator